MEAPKCEKCSKSLTKNGKCRSCIAKINGSKSKGFKKINRTHKLFWLEKGFSEEESKYQTRRINPKYKEYWITKGLSEEDAIKQSDLILKSGIITCKEYWITKGLSEEAAKNKAKKIVSDRLKYSDENNILRKEFWIKRGYSEKVSLQKIKEEQFKRFNYDSDFSEKVSKGKKLYYKNLTDEEKDKWKKIYIKHSKKMKRDLSFSPIFEDYWIKRGYSKENSKIKSLETRYVNPKNYSSNIEKKCIKEIEDFLKIDIQKNKYVMILSNVFVVDGKFDN